MPPPGPRAPFDYEPYRRAGQLASRPSDRNSRLANVVSGVRQGDEEHHGWREGPADRCPRSFDLLAGPSGVDRVFLDTIVGNWVVGVANIELHENMGLARPPSIPPPDAQPASRVGCRGVRSLQIASYPSVGKPRTTAPARHPASLGEAA